MIYALRKLIAFVFLGGIFWFVYRDVERIYDPQFQMAVAALVVLFAVFWLGVPWAVVRLRIAQREAKNLRGFAEWRDRFGEEHQWRKFHEKGTLYIEPGTEFDAISTVSRIGDVAFPKEPRMWRKIQRVHFYYQNDEFSFKGKEIDLRLDRSDLSGMRTAPGGIVFGVAKKNIIPYKLAFTFANPLIAAEVIASR